MTYTKPFETVYSHYPLKKGKFQAMKTWTKLYAELPDLEVMINAIAAQKKERAFLKRQNRFVPPWKHFSTWLNAGCWTDECELEIPVVRAMENGPSASIQNLQRGYNILQNIGEEEFRSFCKQTKMPPQDIEAIEFKHSGRYDINKLVSRVARGV